MIRPRFIYYLLFSITVWLASHIGEWSWSNLLFFFLLILPLISLLIALWQRRKIQIDFYPDQAYIERNAHASWYLRLSSHNRFHEQFVQAAYRENPLGEVEHIQPLAISAGEDLELIFEMSADHVGPLKPQYLEVKTTDPCRFFTLNLASFVDENIPPIWVLPRSLISLIEKSESKPYLETAESVSQKSNHDLDEIDLIRPMRRGDHRKDIHWKLSARMQDWMVRQYEKADENKIYILCNLPSVDFSSKQVEQILDERDLILDQVSEASQSFLSQDFSLVLSLRNPLREELEINNLDYYEFLRIILAKLPHTLAHNFAHVVEEELLFAKSRFYCLFTSELNPEIVSSILILNSEVQGILLRLITPKNLPPREWKPWLEELSAAGVKISLGRRSQA